MPANPTAAWLSQALQHHQAGQLAQAEALYRKILQADPRHADALQFLGLLAHQAGHSEDGIRLIQQAISINPQAAPQYSNLALILGERGRSAEAAAALRRAVQLQPGYVEAWYNLGLALIELKQFTEAAASLQQALQLQPTHAHAWNDLGRAYKDLDRFDDALNAFDRAIALAPHHAGAHYNRAFMRLLRGEYATGWREYEWRIATRSNTPYLPDPRDPRRWLPLPSSLLPFAPQGRKVLLLPDQGIGDEWFFLRFVPALRARGAQVFYQPFPKIAGLAARLPFLDGVLKPSDALPAGLDALISIGDLPLLSGETGTPPPVRLAPLPACLQAQAERLREYGPPPYIGVTWRAGTPYHFGSKNMFKAIPLQGLAEVLRPLSATILVLQREPQVGEIAEFSRLLGRPVHDCSGLNDDLENMLALLALLDDYVGVSNTNMHLRAAAGKTARVLAEGYIDWRWQAGGDTSAWYPGFILYREPSGGNWKQAWARLARDLAG